MVWKLTKKADGLEPLNGAPAWVNLSDDEMEDADKAYAATGMPRHALRDSGYWVHEEDKAKTTSSKE